MLTTIENETLHWQCLLYDTSGDLLSCGTMKQAHISEAQYVMPDGHSSKGAIIMLPPCECGVQLFLKADYSVKEAWRCTLPVVNSEGHTWAFAMTLGHARNFIAHWMLYDRGEATHAPCIDRPPVGASIEGVPHDVFASLWFANVARIHASPKELERRKDAAISESECRITEHGNPLSRHRGRLFRLS